MPTAGSNLLDGDRLRQDAARLSAILVRKAGIPRFSVAGRAGRFYLARWDGENLSAIRNAESPSAWRMRRTGLAQFDCALSYGLCEYQRTLAVLQPRGGGERWHPMAATRFAHIAAGLGSGNESYPDLFQPYGGFPDAFASRTAITCPICPASGLKKIRSLQGDEALAS